MLIGLRIQADDSRGSARPMPTFAEGSDVRLALRVQASLANENCGANNPGLPCPDPDTTVVALRVSALADLTTPVKASEVLTVSAGSPVDRIVPLPLGLLPAGRHCVTVLVSERVEPVVRQQLPYHASSVTRFFQVGAATADHCRATTPSRYTPVEGPGDSAGCTQPTSVLTVNAVGSRPRTLQRGEALYANVLLCGSETTVLFARNGELVGRGSPLAPVTLSAAAVVVQARYADLDAADYLLMAVPSERPGQVQISALVGNPVLVT